ncbi:hypothetical protein Cgig2_000432 [Carnegiea gigantea]|uniref:Uncharacterized protein n=1 Tax=Carnegiea gigantea TaxID=171969 RepID=A0A9Q1JPE3_9CARY|nr:hypothetical protein Cgig2_000432 [Carnegiea gigantea]
MALYVLGNFESYRREVAFPTHPLPSDYKELAKVKEYARDYERSASRPPPPLSKDYRDLCPRFTLSDAEKAARDFELPKMIQATFYAMLLNDTIELGLVDTFMAVNLRATLEGSQWTSFKSWLNVDRRDLLEAQLRQRTPPEAVHGPVDSQEESSSSNDPPPPLACLHLVHRVGKSLRDWPAPKRRAAILNFQASQP